MKKRPIVALIYDFDGTLSPGNMQEFGFIQAIGKTPDEFWRMSDGLAVGQDASNVLSYMKMMFDEARKNGVTLRRSDFRKFGRHIQLFDGVKEWFGMINEYGESRGVQIEHYINSSGLKEIIEGSPIAKEFKHIFACSYMYNKDGEPSGRESPSTTRRRPSTYSRSTREYSAPTTTRWSTRVSPRTRRESPTPR